MAVQTKSQQNILAATACLLTVYHTLYAMVLNHFATPRFLSYVDYALILLTFGALCLYIFGEYRRLKTIPVFLQPLCQSSLMNAYTVVLLVLFGLFLVSALLTEGMRPGTLSENRGCLLDSGISFFVIFPLGLWYGNRNDERLIRGMIDLLTAVYIPILLGAFWSFFIDLDIIPWLNAYQWNGRLAFAAAHPNVIGMTCAMLTMAGMYRILRGAWWVKVLYGVAELVLFAGLILADSRAGMVAVGLSFGILIVLWVWKRFLCDKPPRKIAMIAGVSAVLCVIALWCVIRMGSIMGIGLPTRSFFGGNLGAGSGRLDLWWKILSDVLPNHRDLLIHGCSPYEIPGVLAQTAGTLDKFGYEINTHNQLLEVAMGYGVPAMLVFVLWLILLAKQAWKLGTASFSLVSLSERILPLLLLLLIVNQMFEARLLFYRYAVGSMFFLTAGYVCGSGYHQMSVKSVRRSSVYNGQDESQYRCTNLQN